jgi:hypothetical protein
MKNFQDLFEYYFIVDHLLNDVNKLGVELCYLRAVYR